MKGQRVVGAGLVVVLAVTALALVRGAWSARDAAAQDAQTARQELRSVRAHLTAAQDAVAALRADSVRARATIDSLWRVALVARQRARGAEARWSVARVSAPDTACVALRVAGDSLAVALAAETVRADTTLAAFRAFTDSVSRRVPVVAAAVDSAVVGVERAAAAVRRPWHVRLWRGLRSVGGPLVAGAVGFAAGSLR